MFEERHLKGTEWREKEFVVAMMGKMDSWWEIHEICATMVGKAAPLNYICMTSKANPEVTSGNVSERQREI